MRLMRSLTLSIALLLPVLGCTDDLNEELLLAARKGNVGIVRALLDKGADINAKSPYGATPLYFAASNGHLEVVRLLVERGADVNAKDTFYGITALSSATAKGRAQIVKILIDKGAEGSAQALVTAAFFGHAEVVKVVLKKGSFKAEALSDALGAATKNNHTEIAELLKKAGAIPPPKGDFPVDAETLKTYEGVYRNEQGREFTFTVKDGKLSWIADWGSGILRAVDKTTFKSLEFEGVKFAFQAEGGKVVGFTLQFGETSQKFKKAEGK